MSELRRIQDLVQGAQDLLTPAKRKAIFPGTLKSLQEVHTEFLLKVGLFDLWQCFGLFLLWFGLLDVVSVAELAVFAGFFLFSCFSWFLFCLCVLFCAVFSVNVIASCCWLYFCSFCLPFYLSFCAFCSAPCCFANAVAIYC